MPSVLSPDELERLADVAEDFTDGIARLRGAMLGAMIDAFPLLPAVVGNLDALRAVASGEDTGLDALQGTLFREHTRLEGVSGGVFLSRVGGPAVPAMDHQSSMRATMALAHGLCANAADGDAVYEATSQVLGLLAGSGADVLVSERLRDAFGLR